MNYDGLAATQTGGFTYKTPPAPAITSLSVTSGPVGGGGTVTITGTDFVSGATVKFGAFTASGVTVASATSITATIPPGIAGATVVTVQNPDAQVGSLDAGYTYLGTGPSVTGVSPEGGPVAGGSVVSVTGTGFVKGATVKFGDKPATKVAYISDTELSVTVPAGAEGLVDVAVANPSTETTTLANGFTYYAAGKAAVAATPPPGGLALIVAGTGDLQALIKAQKFTVSAVFQLDVAKQTWKVYIVGAPASVNTLSTIKATDILVLRR
jgi:hypothetical protein